MRCGYMSDSKNCINHKCPCCEYEVLYNWKTDTFVKGDESFIEIENSVGRTPAFETDKPKEYENGEYEKVLLLGCPKCRAVSYALW